MKTAVIGSRDLVICDLGNYLPAGTSEIVSGGAKGVDACAREYALVQQIKLTEFLPEYEKYGRAAPLKRNLEIINYADTVVAFWDGTSKGTKFVIDSCKRIGRHVTVYQFDIQQKGWRITRPELLQINGN